MVALVDSSDLLSVLKSLLHRVSLMSLEQRLNHQKRKPAIDSVDVTDRLFQHLERLSTTNRNDSATNANRAGAAADGGKGPPESSSRGKISREVGSVNNGLRDYLYDMRSRIYSDSSMGKRLQQTTWDHLQKARFNARDGKEELSKFHASIALQAMKSAHAFMSDEDYELFTADINRVLEA